MIVSTWEAWAADLANRMRQLREFDAVIFNFGPHKYVQMLHLPNRVVLNAVGNEHLPVGQKLTAAQETQLRDAGWTEPGPGQPNWHAYFDQPVGESTASQAVELLRHALQDVFGAPNPGELSVEAFNVRESRPA